MQNISYDRNRFSEICKSGQNNKYPIYSESNDEAFEGKKSFNENKNKRMKRADSDSKQEKQGVDNGKSNIYSFSDHKRIDKGSYQASVKRFIIKNKGVSDVFVL